MRESSKSTDASDNEAVVHAEAKRQHFSSDREFCDPKTFASWGFWTPFIQASQFVRRNFPLCASIAVLFVATYWIPIVFFPFAVLSELFIIGAVVDSLSGSKDLSFKGLWNRWTERFPDLLLLQALAYVLLALGGSLACLFFGVMPSISSLGPFTTLEGIFGLPGYLARVLVGFLIIYSSQAVVIDSASPVKAVSRSVGLVFWNFPGVLGLYSLITVATNILALAAAVFLGISAGIVGMIASGNPNYELPAVSAQILYSVAIYPLFLVISLLVTFRYLHDRHPPDSYV